MDERQLLHLEARTYPDDSIPETWAIFLVGGRHEAVRLTAPASSIAEAMVALAKKLDGEP